MSKTPVTLLTGFLGSGKTTLLNRALRNPALERAVVIVNEFGEVGLDHDLIEASDDAVVLLANGCLCCSVRSDLVASLSDLYRKRALGQIDFDRVVIETSGLAEPTPVTEVLMGEPVVAARYRLAGVIATVDAVNGLATLDAHEQSLKQVALADRIVVTKTDLGPMPAGLRERLAALNPAAEVLEGYADGDFGRLFRFAADADRWDDPSLPEPPHGHDSRIQRFTVVRDEPWDRPTLQLFLDALASNAGPALLRVKGLIHVAGSPEKPAVVHGAQQLIHGLSWLERWPSADRRTRIVFITLDWTLTQMQELMGDVERLARRTRDARPARGTPGR